MSVTPIEETTVNETIYANMAFSFGAPNLPIYGTYIDTLETCFGCDSIINLELNIDSEAIVTDVFVKACEVVVFEYSFFTKVAFFSETVLNQAGCDSLSLIKEAVINHII